MKVLIPFVVWCSIVMGQDTPGEWHRVYTGEDSVIEMNVSRVTFGDKKIGRVRYRTVYDLPQRLKSSSQKYKTRNETIEFKCVEKVYRVYASSLHDLEGKEIARFEQDMDEKWRSIKSGGMMEKLALAGCNLIQQQHPSWVPPPRQATLKRRGPTN